MRAYFCDDTPLLLPEGHRYPASKYALLRQRVEQMLPDVRLCSAPAAQEEDLLLAHDPSYVRHVLDGTLPPAMQREIGFPWSSQMALRARRSVGATLAASRSACQEGVAINLAGGTHHAGVARGSGFCVFNDVAVAARAMQAEGLRSIVVVDLDVHQGDGTAAIFAGDSTVVTLSLHGAKNFPFRKQPSDLDVPLPDGCGDLDYLSELERALDWLWKRTESARPELLFYLAGCDVHEGDRLGRLKLTASGIRQRDEMVLQQARVRGLPVVVAMAGGYGRDLEQMVDLQVQTVRSALANWHEPVDRSPHNETP